MPPKAYFEDPLTKGVAFGAAQHVVNNRFTLLKLPVGYGKTIIAMQVAKALALAGGHGQLQLMIIAPKAKRKDQSFDDALAALEQYYPVTIKRLPINGELVGTFAGLRSMQKKPAEWQAFMQRLRAEKTLLILDETHMELRNSTGLANRNFRKIFKDVEAHGGDLRILGLTATPFDINILDSVGYLIVNGNYSSRTDFYKREIVGYVSAFSRGLNQRDIDNMIVDRHYRVHPQMFVNLPRVVKQLQQLIYMPDAPRDFHLPQNKIIDLPVTMTEASSASLAFVERKDHDKAYTDNGSKNTDYTRVVTTDPAMLDQLMAIVNRPGVNQPLIFYLQTLTLDAIKARMQQAGIAPLEINGSSQSYFRDNDGTRPVLIQYLSGAAAFESKTSNTSIYIDLPPSSINFQQSLGRNARRGQEIETVNNYILVPHRDNGDLVPWFKKRYDRVVNKARENNRFEKVFETPWGRFKETLITVSVRFP